MHNTVVLRDIATRADLDGLIETFYGRVFADEQIGLFFTQVAHVTPQTHFPLMADFWERVLFGRCRYQDTFIELHVELHLKHALKPNHVRQWMTLFCLTVEDLFSGPTAEAAMIRARSLAMVLLANDRRMTIRSSRTTSETNVKALTS